MGKLDEEGVPVTSSSSSLSAADSSSTDPRRGRGCRSRAICRFLSLKCFFSVIFSLAVIVSSVFWLLSYIRGADREDLVLWRSGAQIEASFKLQGPVSFLRAKSTILKLEYDILGEIGVPNTTVVIISLHSHSRSNWTNVVFGVLPYAEDSPISSAGLSILRSSLVSLVIQQSNLQLTPSMFGVPSSFEVLKFPGGITITPDQHVFLLQKVQVRFNFTLNYPIYQIQDNLDELKNQLKLGLHLRQHEALYVKLTNLKGSTLSPPVIVQASIFAEVGLPLAAPRVKQLAQTITDSPERNLGLNHRVFGKVKEVRLSSSLPYSLGGDGSPSPAPAPHQNHHHHHHHGHHHHHHNFHVAPASAPSPRPATNYVSPHHHRYALPPSQCHTGSSLGHKRNAHVAPVTSPSASVQPKGDRPASSVRFPAAPPLRAVYFAHVHPPSITAAPSKSVESSPVASPGDANRVLPLISSPSPSPASSSFMLMVPWALLLGALLVQV
ncbi:uncharacterized protein LOC116261505 [Nymphaea colorata]|nr:uncharacterized protein LOC116261505 [Nymphaea colorata]